VGRQELHNLFIQETPVRGEGETDLVLIPRGQSLHVFDGAPDEVKGEKRLASIEADGAFLGKKGMEEIHRPGQGSEIQAVLPLFLITVGTIEIALVRRNDGDAFELQMIDGAFPE
jgi:hypothetical protein